MCACAHGNNSRPRIVYIAAVLEHVKLIVAAASIRGNTVIDFRFVDCGYTAVEAELALVQHSNC